MKYILTILISTIVTVLNGQPLCKIDTRYRMLGNRHAIHYDTLGFNSSLKSKYLYGDLFDASFFVKEYVWETAYYEGVIIQSSVPKGGPYTDPNGERFGYSIFWTRIINETDTPLELTISFNSFTLFPSPDSFLKLFLPSDTMTLANTIAYDYGVDVKSFLDKSFSEPTVLQRTINPNEEYFFNIGALSDQGGSVERAELVLKGQDLFYRILGPHLDPELIPCGRIVIKK
ncbi:MAG: hypothetical protein ABI663_03245 [Chryseolinea sp.]